MSQNGWMKHWYFGRGQSYHPRTQEVKARTDEIAGTEYRQDAAEKFLRDELVHNCTTEAEREVVCEILYSPERLEAFLAGRLVKR
jgi:hypothetical protein